MNHLHANVVHPSVVDLPSTASQTLRWGFSLLIPLIGLRVSLFVPDWLLVDSIVDSTLDPRLDTRVNTRVDSIVDFLVPRLILSKVGPPCAAVLLVGIKTD